MYFLVDLICTGSFLKTGVGKSLKRDNVCTLSNDISLLKCGKHVSMLMKYPQMVADGSGVCVSVTVYIMLRLWFTVCIM